MAVLGGAHPCWKKEGKKNTLEPVVEPVVEPVFGNIRKYSETEQKQDQMTWFSIPTPKSDPNIFQSVEVIRTFGACCSSSNQVSTSTMGCCLFLVFFCLVFFFFDNTGSSGIVTRCQLCVGTRLSFLDKMSRGKERCTVPIKPLPVICLEIQAFSLKTDTSKLATVASSTKKEKGGVTVQSQ